MGVSKECWGGSQGHMQVRVCSGLFEDNYREVGEMNSEEFLTIKCGAETRMCVFSVAVLSLH